MIIADQPIWRLSKRGDQNFGLACTEEGLFLGRTPLLERQGSSYAVRPKGDLERLLGHAYGPAVGVARVLPGLATVAAALSQKNLCLAQIAALHLRLPHLPDAVTRARLETEDWLIKRAQSDDALACTTWDEAEHPRAGVPPNPGWFAPKPGSGVAPAQVAAGEREEREPEELADPTGPARQVMWDARIARLREIDPANPSLTYFSNPSSPPSQEALDRLDAAIEAASIKRVIDKIMPHGRPIGRRGRDPSVRVLPGGMQAAKGLFDYLRVGGQIRLENDKITVVELPGRAGYVAFRPVSNSGPPAVDINVPGLPFEKIHFP